MLNVTKRSTADISTAASRYAYYEHYLLNKIFLPNKMLTKFIKTFC